MTSIATANNIDLLELQSTALEAAANGVVITDINGSILWVNSAFTKLTGYSKEDVLNKNPNVLKSDKHSEKFYEYMWNRIKTGHVWHNTLINKRKDGTLYNEDMTITPVKNASGEITNFIAVKQDITQKVNNEIKIKNQNKFLNDILESITQPIYVVNVDDYTIETGNLASNFSKGDIPLTCHEQTHHSKTPCSTEEHPCPMEEIRKTKKPFSVEHVHFDEFGKERNMEVHGYPIINNHGEVEKIIEYSIDITKRKSAERELHESNYKFEQLLNNSILGIMRLDIDGNIIMVNPAMMKMLGYDSLEDLLILPKEKVFSSKSNRDRLLAILKREEKVYGIEDEFLKKDGSKIIVKQSAWGVKDLAHNFIYFEVIIEDITETNEVLKIVHEAEYKYRMLIDKLNEAVFLMVENKFEVVNKRFLELFETDEDQIFSENFDIFQFMSQESKTTVLKRHKMIEAGEEVPSTYEIEITTRNGNDKIIEVSVSYFKSNDKILTQGIARDLSKIKMQETQIRHLQKMEAIGTLAAGIAHEINTPAQFINDNLTFLHESQILLKPLYKLLDIKSADSFSFEELQKIKEEVELDYYLEEIPLAINQSLDGIQRISNIVGAMRDFSHSGPKEKTTTDLHNLITTSTIISKNAWKYIAEVQTDFDNSIEPIICLASELGQVIVNMIVNSAHAMESKFKNTNELSGLIQIKTLNHDDKVEIVIKDNGSGIPKKLLKRVFDPFFTTKDVGKGTGQGLAIAHDIIVNKHNGNIDVTSEEGIGTTFVIHLPKE